MTQPAAEFLDFSSYRFGDFSKPKFLKPPNQDTVTHGWRFYGVRDDKLISPIVGRYCAPNYDQTALPRNGIMDGAFFVPDAELFWWSGLPRLVNGAAFCTGRFWEDSAITFGKVDWPLELDPLFEEVGSMKATRYHAKIIIAKDCERFRQNYDVPLMEFEDSLDQLLAIEPVFRGGQVDVEGNPPQPPDRKLRIYFVCSYNIGRSAMAAIMLANQLMARGLSGFAEVYSAGTSDWAIGQPIDPQAAQVLRDNGHGVSPHKAYWVGHDLNSMSGADLIVAMEQHHVISLVNQYGINPARVRLLRSFDPNVHTHSGIDVKNPYSLADFKYTFSLIAAALPGLHKWVDERITKWAFRNQHDQVAYPAPQPT
jgi:protein-tyrosine phosphatase